MMQLYDEESFLRSSDIFIWDFRK